MRLVVEVADAQLLRFKAAVAAEKRTQADVIRTFLDEYIDASDKRRSRKKEDHQPRTEGV